MQCNFDQWQLADLTVTPKVGKQAPLMAADKTPFIVTPPMRLVAPFGPGVYEGAANTARQNLDFRCTPELEAWTKKFDEWAVQYISKHAGRILGKKMPAAQVQDSLRPRPPNLTRRVKILRDRTVDTILRS